MTLATSTVSDNATLELGVVLGIALFVVLTAWQVTRIQARSDTSIARRLRKSGGPISIRIPSFSYAWNPADLRRRIFGPGRAVYWLEEPNTVHLKFQSGSSGREEIYSGPLPKSPETRRRRVHRPSSPRMRRWCVLLLIGGVALGWYLAEGSLIEHLFGTALGLLAALTVVMLGFRFSRATSSVKSSPGSRG
jgi:hypothetical protein